MGVITNGSGGGSGGGIRYNATNDTIEVKYNGQWVRVMGAGAQWDGYLVNNGNLYESITGGYEYVLGGNSNNKSGEIGVDSSGFFTKCTIGSDNFFGREGQCEALTIDSIDISEKGFTSLYVEGTMSGQYSEPSSQSAAQQYIATVRISANDVILKTVRVATASGKSFTPVTIGQTIDISTLDVSQPIKVSFLAWAYSGNAADTVTTIMHVAKARFR